MTDNYRLILAQEELKQLEKDPIENFERIQYVREEIARCTITQTPSTAVLLHRQHVRWDRTAVRCIETGEVYDSAAAAAHALGVGRGTISNHLAGRYPHVRGKHFERVEGSE